MEKRLVSHIIETIYYIRVPYFKNDDMERFWDNGPT